MVPILGRRFSTLVRQSKQPKKRRGMRLRSTEKVPIPTIKIHIIKMKVLERKSLFPQPSLGVIYTAYFMYRRRATKKRKVEISSPKASIHRKVRMFTG